MEPDWQIMITTKPLNFTKMQQSLTGLPLNKHGKGDHAKGMEHSKSAQQHSQSANKQSDQAHAKSQQQK
jgi:hypothetical protein